MKQKIFAQLCVMVALAILATGIIVTGLFYRHFKEQIFHMVKSYAYVLESADAYARAEQIEEIHQLDNLRITIVATDGQVLLDTDVSVETMENHAGREEILEALENGSGQAKRLSATLSKSTYYYAVRMSDGNVLRVAVETHSIFNIIGEIMPLVMLMAAVLFLICMVLGRILTDTLLRPIEHMAQDMNFSGESAVYEEMGPFIDKIRQQYEDILKNANMRQEFTANVSHELKTPLAAISGYSELIENGMVSDEDVAYFGGQIHKSADRLLTLINDTIRLSELDTAGYEEKTEEVNLYQMATICVDALQINAKKHEVKLCLDGQNCIIHASGRMIEEVIYNLCDNAIRYNNKGGSVIVTVKPAEEYVLLSVKDTGIGISKEDQERIFERFYRVDKGRSKSTGGTGLGLAIVKHIVAQVGAKMELESEVGKGTEIRIYFVPAEASIYKCVIDCVTDVK